MELDQIMKMLKGKTEIKLVKFISDKGPNSCEECLKHHGEIFQADDPDKPELPIHPNCRCKYELMTQAEVISYQDDLQKIKTQLINYGNQIAAQATQLLAECDEEIKTHTVTHTANAVVTALPAVYQTIKAIKKGKNLEEKVTSTVTSAKLTAMVTALQITMMAMQKINHTAEVLHREMEKAGIFDTIKEYSPWLQIEKWLKDYQNEHYTRSNLWDQQLHNLPQSPEAAEKMGFTRASSLENMYHRNKNQKRNVKYYNKKTGQEVIFNENGTIVTDPENIGTFNYAPPADKMGHFLADMVPYYLFGNSKDDSTPIINRIISRPELWSDLLYEKYNEISQATKKSFDSIIMQIKKILPIFE